MERKILVLVLAMVLVGSVLIRPSLGVESIEITCPFGPGTTSDIMCRLVAQTAPKYLGQPMVVINKPGSAGTIAAADVINSKPGTKLFPHTQFFHAIVMKTQKVPFSASDLVPLRALMEYRLGIMVKGDSPWKTLNDLIEYGKKNPGKLRWSHGGRGLSNHMAALSMFRKAGVEAIDIPYPGSGPEEHSALLGGHVEASSLSYGPASGLIRSGRIRVLVFFNDRRYSDLPDIPCATELGFPEIADFVVYVALFAHKQTPENTKHVLMEAFRKTCEDPEFRKGMEKAELDRKCGGPEFIEERTKKAEELGVPIIKELGLYVGK